MRDPEAVLRDIKDETLTLEQAERRFGVITTTKGDIDPEATARRREELMAFRVVLTIETVDDNTFDGAKRLFGISWFNPKRHLLSYRFDFACFRIIDTKC